MNVLFALLFSLIAPGAGQAYNGQRKKSLWVATGYLLSRIIFDLKFLTHPAHVVTPAFKLWLIAGFLIPAGLYVGSFVDALIQALRIRKQGVRSETSNWKASLLICVVLRAYRVIVWMWFRMDHPEISHILHR